MKTIAELKRVLHLQQKAISCLLEEAKERLTSNFGTESDAKRKKFVFRAEEALGQALDAMSAPDTEKG